MRVALVSSFDIDGGAAKAAYRLHRALEREPGVEPRMFVQVRTSGDASVDGASSGARRIVARLRPYVDHLPARLAGSTLGEFSLNWLPSGLAARMADFAPDLVHLHGLHGGYVALRDISRLGRPVVWTAHDMWPFTGGCHYDRGCEGFAGAGCRPCPQAPRLAGLAIAAGRLKAKAAACRQAQPMYVSPSNWLAGVAARSAVGIGAGVKVIPNGVDLDRFKPIDKQAARSLFGLPPEKTILLFGAVNANSDSRKGFDLLDAALALLGSGSLANRLMLCVYGSTQRGIGMLHGIPTLHTGHLHDDESLVALYSAADLFVAPSRQDNLPNTVLEATACGLPSVGFAIGGLPDLVNSGVTGWLADEVSARSLAAVLEQALVSPALLADAGVAARKLALARFSDRASASAYAAAYVELMERADAAQP